MTLYRQLKCFREALLYWVGVGSLWMSNKLLCMINKWQISTYCSFVVAYHIYIWVIIGLCKLLIDGTKPLTEILMTFIKEDRWNLLRKISHIWSKGDRDWWWHITSRGLKVLMTNISYDRYLRRLHAKDTYPELMDFSKGFEIELKCILSAIKFVMMYESNRF